MNLEEIKKYLEENKDNEEVKSYLQGLSKVTIDGVTTFLETEDGKKFLQPKLDSYFSKGLETWKGNNLEKLIEEEIKKRNPQADPKDIELNKLKAEVERIQQEALREKLKSKAVTVAGEKKLPIQLVEFLLGNDEEATLANLTTFEEVFNSHLQTRVQEQLKDGGIDPKKDTKQTGTLTLEQIKNMSREEVMANMDAVNAALAANK